MKFIVWCPTAYQAPQKTFTSEKEAQKVAEIMVMKNPGSVFHVCKVVGTAKMKAAEYEKAGR